MNYLNELVVGLHAEAATRERGDTNTASILAWAVVVIVAITAINVSFQNVVTNVLTNITERITGIGGA